MSKPVWLEDWEQPIPEHWTIWMKRDHRHLAQFDGRGPDTDTPEQRVANLVVQAARAQLAAAAPALVRALLRLEWGANGTHCEPCQSLRPSGQRAGVRGHANDCYVDAALTAAGFADQAARDAARQTLSDLRGR